MSSIENFIKQIQKTTKIKNKNFIDTNNTVISHHKQILQIFELAEKEFDNTTFKNTKKENHNVTNNYFSEIPIFIRKQIFNARNFYSSFEFSINSRNFKISFYSQDNFFQDNQKFKLVYIILFLFNYISDNQECSKNLNINIYLSPLKKTIPNNQILVKVLDREHINSAFTFNCMTSNEIYIFRQEEWFKCLIHECIHAFGFDFSQKTSKDNDIYSSKILQKIFPINFDLSLYEAYTECLAIYLNSLINCYNNTYKKTSIDFFDRVLCKVENILNKELYFSMFQVAKILNYYSIDYNDIYIKNNAVLHKYDENTPVFSYFIIKTILLYHFSDFFNWCIKHNKFILNFKCTNINKNNKSCNRKIKLFCDFIISKYKNPSFINDMNDITMIYNNIKNSNQIFKTLRFSIYG